MKEYIEDLVVNKCRQLLTDENIEIIANEVVKINELDKSEFEIKQLEKDIANLNKQKANLMDALKLCDMDDVKQDIFNEMKNINNQIQDIQSAIAVIKKETATFDKEEIIFFLNGLKNGDVNSKRYRKTLITIFVNSIFLYDDKIVYVFNTGKEPVEMPFEYLNEITEENCSDLLTNGSPRKTS